MSLPDLHRAAREIFAEALKSVDAARAVRRAVELNGSSLRLLDTDFDLQTRRSGIYSIAIGKAALAMAASLDAILGDRLTAGVIAGSTSGRTKEQQSVQQIIDAGQFSEEESEAPTFRNLILQDSMPLPKDAKTALPEEPSFHDRWRVFAGGHPLPNADSLRAAQASFELLRRADGESALIIFLISGGGSAMIEWPRDEQTTLEELRAANRILISCGASIAEINVVRRALSSIKGGGLAARAPHADQVSLIISDTGAGDEANVASGPTFELPHALLSAVAVIERYNLASRLPASILRAISQSPPPTAETVTPPHALRKHYVLLDNRHAIASAAEAARLRGFKVEFAHDLVEQGVAEGSAELLSRLLNLRRRTRRSEQRAICLISGGEFACPVRGDGVGGRNAETALRCAIEMDARAAVSINQNQSEAHTVVLSAGTDGIDGNSPAAGAISDETTLKRARALGLDAQSALEQSDAYTFFNALGDTLLTGPTSTNVRDLRILLAS